MTVSENDDNPKRVSKSPDDDGKSGKIFKLTKNRMCTAYVIP